MPFLCRAFGCARIGHNLSPFCEARCERKPLECSLQCPDVNLDAFIETSILSWTMYIAPPQITHSQSTQISLSLPVPWSPCSANTKELSEVFRYAYQLLKAHSIFLSFRYCPKRPHRLLSKTAPHRLVVYQTIRKFVLPAVTQNWRFIMYITSAIL